MIRMGRSTRRMVNIDNLQKMTKFSPKHWPKEVVGLAPKFCILSCSSLKHIGQSEPFLWILLRSLECGGEKQTNGLDHMINIDQ